VRKHQPHRLSANSLTSLWRTKDRCFSDPGALHNSFCLSIERITAHIVIVMTGTSMDSMDVLFWVGVIWGPSLLLMVYLVIPSRRRQAD
jgi:hypothetical protein